MPRPALRFRGRPVGPRRGDPRPRGTAAPQRTGPATNSQRGSAAEPVWFQQGSFRRYPTVCRRLGAPDRAIAAPIRPPLETHTSGANHHCNAGFLTGSMPASRAAMENLIIIPNICAQHMTYWKFKYCNLIDYSDIYKVEIHHFGIPCDGSRLCAGIRAALFSGFLIVVFH